MFNIENLIGQFTGSNANPQAVEGAATEHLSEMDSGELAQHLQTAADNANQNGNNDVAGAISGLISQNQGNPQGLKDAAISYIKNNPQVLTHFAPPFAQGILSRIGL